MEGNSVQLNEYEAVFYNKNGGFANIEFKVGVQRGFNAIQ